MAAAGELPLASARAYLRLHTRRSPPLQQKQHIRANYVLDAVGDRLGTVHAMERVEPVRETKNAAGRCPHIDLAAGAGAPQLALDGHQKARRSARKVVVQKDEEGHQTVAVGVG